MPVEIVLGNDAILSINSKKFVQRNLWTVAKELRLYRVDAGIEREDGSYFKKYPSIEISGRVTRNCGFFMINVVLPMCLFSAAAFLTYFTPRQENDSRLGVSTTLLLTTAAYKFAFTTMCPSVTYLTLCDKYASLSSLFVMVMVFENGIMHLGSDSVDDVFYAVLFTLWLMLQFWFFTYILVAKDHLTWWNNNASLQKDGRVSRRGDDLRSLGPNDYAELHDGEQARHHDQGRRWTVQPSVWAAADLQQEKPMAC